MTKRLPPFGDRAREGEVLPPEVDVSPLDQPHSNEEPARKLHGGDPNPDDLTPEWITKRLMREATDHGTRTRQSSRVDALKTLAKIAGMLEDKGEDEKPTAVKLAELPPEQRRAIMAERIAQLARDGEIDLDEIRRRARE